MLIKLIDGKGFEKNISIDLEKVDPYQSLYYPLPSKPKTFKNKNELPESFGFESIEFRFLGRHDYNNAPIYEEVDK